MSTPSTPRNPASPADTSTDGADPRPMEPGVPSAEPISLPEPTGARPPAPPKPDQAEPAAVSPTGVPTGAPLGHRAQHGEYLTTAQGVRLPDTDHSLKAGPRGPVLLRDHHLREKITHFDHERIPERVVHARGAGAHGVFRSYGTAAQVTRAAFLAPDTETPVFVRFSTVLGSRGSADTVRDTRGFAVKFYTDEGTFDLVGNNIPVFFIQDAIKFPDVIHAGKPHPDREIPQAQSAHDTFWDFVSLHTEAQHHTMWNMSDRGIPRSYRMMEGFGVHTFRLVDEAGATCLVKFHWKPVLGVHSLVWEEAQLLSGVDPDFHRRDLADAIESGHLPEWDLGIQVFPDTEDQTFEGIDLLDATKIVPEELAPVQPVGRLTLTANPSNYFAETEQVAFHTGHLVPGIDATDDPLLAGRMFSYLDTQITRLGGPNFGQLPINRPQVPVNDMLRDGMHQTAVHRGVAPYRPNSLDGGCPFVAGADIGGYVEVPQLLPESRKVRQAPASFADHYSQVRLFWLSMSAVEQDHIVAAYSFELAKCYDETIRQRQLIALARIDDRLCVQVAEALGMEAPPSEVTEEPEPSPALSQVVGEWPVAGRVVGVIAGSESGSDTTAAIVSALAGAGLRVLVLAPVGGRLAGVGELTVNRTFATMRSVELDAVVVSDGISDPRVDTLLREAFRHAKAIAAVPGATDVLEAAGIRSADEGVVLEADPAALTSALTGALARHRAWDRTVGASASAGGGLS